MHLQVWIIDELFTSARFSTDDDKQTVLLVRCTCLGNIDQRWSTETNTSCPNKHGDCVLHWQPLTGHQPLLFCPLTFLCDEGNKRVSVMEWVFTVATYKREIGLLLKSFRLFSTNYNVSKEVMSEFFYIKLAYMNWKSKTNDLQADAYHCFKTNAFSLANTHTYKTEIKSNRHSFWDQTYTLSQSH